MVGRSFGLEMGFFGNKLETEMLPFWAEEKEHK
jgi:hypothetical protein